MALHLSLEEERTPLLGPASTISSKVLSETKVYPLIHLIRVDILIHIDTPLTYDQLIAPDSTYTIIRPLTEKYLELRNQATVFCLLLNKVQFVRDSVQLSINTLSLSRATLCEILAIRVLRGWSERSLPLATVLLTPWALFQGASEEVIARAKEDGDEDILTEGGNALEMAIVSSSKRFIRSPSCQKVIEGIWSGRIIYSGVNAHALIADNYKKKPIQMYNPHKAPLLDHYRLKVPRVRSFLEYSNFLVLFVLYVVAVEGLEEDQLNAKEIAFIVYALAYSLDKLATIREHGLKVFSSSLVNGFDFVFMLIYAVYLGARVYGFHYSDPDALALGADWLAIGAVLIFPRLAFVTLANNLMVLSIRSMLTEFFFLMGIGIFCFLGFLYALFTLGQGRFELSQIGWWLLEVYFGLDASGFETSHDLHPFLGPVLMVTYALLSNTLLLTVLVAILGNTFATINADAAAESMFRKAVSTIEGVKSDAVFSYQLPFNIVAVIFMWPISYILNPRWFHKVNVFMIRASNFPVLLLIALYERQQYRETTLMERIGDYAERYVGSLPRRLKAAAGFENFGSRHDISMVFEIEREVGSFYRGWEDEGYEDGAQLPPAFEDESDDSPETPKESCEPSQTSGNEDSRSATSNGQEVLVWPQTAPMTASPARFESTSPRTRRDSTPAGRPTSPEASSFPPRGNMIPRPRRLSSIHEPSPLARLFVRGSGDQSDIVEQMRERRQSLINFGFPSSQSQPLFSPSHRRTKSHGRNIAPPHFGSSGAAGPTGSTGPTGADEEIRHRATHLPKPQITPIEEGKKVHFGSGDTTPEPGSRAQLPRPRGSGVPVSRQGDPSGGVVGGSQVSSGSTHVGRASEIEAREAGISAGSGTSNEDQGRERAVNERLDDIEKGHKRIEEVLARLETALSRVS